MPNSHLSGCGCPKCANNYVTTTEEFIEKAKIKHGNLYDYSLVDYNKNKKHVNIICLVHGSFLQIPNTHLLGCGCPKCAYEENGKNCRKTNNEFIDESNLIHKNKYDYSLVDYVQNKTKIKIICKKHGEFEQVPNTHLSGHGCPKCKQSRGEIKIEQFFLNNNITYIYQKSFDDCKYKRKLIFDFYLPEYNLCAEYDGRQHFEPINFFGGEEALKLLQITDEIKNQYCRDNNVNLIRIKYNENVEDKLKIIENFKIK